MRRFLHRRWALFTCFALLLSLPFLACENTDPIRVGFIGGLSGRTAQLGIEGRDGALLALEQIDANGGINGRSLALITRDDRQDVDSARWGISDLIDSNAAAVIGHMTSSMTVSVIDIVNERSRVLLSPTTSTNELAGIDDMFFRVYPESAQAARTLATYLARERGIKTVSAVLDTDNDAHTRSWLDQFALEFESRGGSVIQEVPFSSSAQHGFYDIAETIAETGPEAVFILANALDTALLAQQFPKLGFQPLLAASEWSSTDDLIVQGGSAVEGIIFLDTYDRSSTAPAYRAFVDSFVRRFGYEPRFAAVHAYDCMNILARVLSETTDPGRIKETILGIRTFEGLQGPIRFNEYGDVIRPHYLMTVQDGAFVSLGIR